MVRFEKVAMRYGNGPQILHGIDLDLEQGSFHFLTGPSGAGKSTLLRLMYLAERPSEGAISLFGHDVQSLGRTRRAQLRRHIGVVFQEFRLLDHLSAVDNVALPLRVTGIKEETVMANATELLRWVGLEEKHLTAQPSTLSGGQQQRLAIARAVIGRPALLIADEPTGNVDDAMAMRLMYLFEELNRLGTTVVIATHNQALIDHFGHPVLYLERGALTRIDRRNGEGIPVPLAEEGA